MGPKVIKPKGIKWTRDEIITLIDAYKIESSLYAVSSANYHNKYLRSEALKRVGEAVRCQNVEIEDKDCAAKFHSLRTQYNIENAKVKSSMTSGTGTDDVYQPTLWYFELLRFLDSFYTPRKGRNSTNNPGSSNLKTAPQNVQTQDESSWQSQESTSSQSIIDEGITADGHLAVYIEDELSSCESFLLVSNSAEQQGRDEGDSQKEMIEAQHKIRSVSLSPALLRPSPSRSPALSSSSGISVDCPPPVSTLPRKRKRGDDESYYTGVIQSLTNSLKQPVVIPKANTPDPVEGCMVFLGSVLRTFKSEELQLEVINNLTQTVLNARNEDIKKSNSVQLNSKDT